MQPLTDEERKKLVADLREYANDLTFEGTIARVWLSLTGCVRPKREEEVTS